MSILLGILRWFFGLIFAILFVFVFLVSFFMVRVDRTLLNPDFLIHHLRDANVYTWVSDKLIPEVVRERVTQLPSLPAGVTVTHQEIIDAVMPVVPPQWLQEQTEAGIRQVLPYVVGKTDRFEVVVPLADRREAAINSLSGLADKELSESYQALSICTLQQLEQATRELQAGRFPEPCRPPGMSYPEAKRIVNLDIVITTEIRRAVESVVPASVTVTERDLVAQLEENAGVQSVEDFNNIRGRIERARGLLFVFPIVGAALLALASLLNASGWWGRLRTGAIMLVVASVVVMIFATVVQRVANTGLDTVYLTGLPASADEKIIGLFHAVFADFFGGLRSSVIPYLVVGVVAVVLSILGQLFLPARRRGVLDA